MAPGPRWSRRAFLGDLARFGGSLAALGLLASCSPPPPPAGPGRAARVGVLLNVIEESVVLPDFLARLAELGYVEGAILAIERRSTEGDPTRMDDLAAELAGIPVDVILALGGTAIRAAMAATTSIPIVMSGSPDPVASGYVQSLARPGGNVTGLTGPPPGVTQKQLQLLVEAVPSVSRVAVLGGSTGLLRSAAALLGIELLGLSDLTTADSYESAILSAVASGADGLLVRPVEGANVYRDLIANLAERHRLPGTYPLREYVTSGGGLMAYVDRASETRRRMADYVDRILKGARPADLPVEVPSRYDLILNLRTARALGLSFSRDFLAQVDEVVE